MYSQNCKIRTCFDWTDCVNRDINVRGEVCLTWSNASIVQHYESNTEAMDKYVVLSIDRGDGSRKVELHVGGDENSDTTSISSLQVSQEQGVENIYITNNQMFCSPTTPTEGDVCELGGKTGRRVLNTDCAELEWKWTLENKRFQIHFAAD